MKLLTSQKDTLFDVIERVGLSPSQFKFDMTPGPGHFVTNLIFKNSEFQFSFGDMSNSSVGVYCPGTDTYREKIGGDWNHLLEGVNQWLLNIVREINTPNKWDRLCKEIAGIEINLENDENKFSAIEYEDLQQRILTLKQGITSIKLLPDQMSAINNKLDHLVDLAKAMSKFDWKSLFIGTIASIVIQLSVTPSNAQSLWTLIKQIFNNLLLPLQ